VGLVERDSSQGACRFGGRLFGDAVAFENEKELGEVGVRRHPHKFPDLLDELPAIFVRRMRIVQTRGPLEEGDLLRERQVPDGLSRTLDEILPGLHPSAHLASKLGVGIEFHFPPEHHLQNFNGELKIRLTLPMHRVHSSPKER
jgi:hypothetical protein